MPATLRFCFFLIVLRCNSCCLLRHSKSFLRRRAFMGVLIFGALNWTAQWFDARKGASLDELTDAAMGLFIGKDPRK